MKQRINKLPREIWVAAISLKGLWPVSTSEKRMKDIVNRIEKVLIYNPDVICLPEMVNISWVEERRPLDEIAEDEVTGEPVLEALSTIAKNNNCYITCPVITKRDGRFYNSSILVDRNGNPTGVFHKIHPTSAEIVPGKYYKGGGITPGQINANTMDADFGKIGLQICADADWADGWQALKKNGAELVCFSSQGPYSNTIRDRAWLNQYFIASATGEDAQIVDITGDVLAVDNPMTRWACAAVNLEKVLVKADENEIAIGQIVKKYGRGVRINIYYHENWATIESRATDINVKELLHEYSIRSFIEEMVETQKLIDARCY